MVELKGIVPPVVTPLHADERVDEAALERQLTRLLEAGVHGIFLLGSNGEQPALRDRERVRVLQVAARVVGGRVPVVAGTMASSTARTVDHIREAAEIGVDAVAVTPPYYYPSRGPEDQFAHYRECARAGAPVLVYNIPMTTKVMLSAETVARITELPEVIGIKDSSGDYPHVLKLIQKVRGEQGKAVLVGVPPIAVAAILQGASGAVPGIANICPRTMLDLWKATSCGDVAATEGPQARVGRLMDLLSLGSPIVCVKTALELMGICAAHATMPLQPLPSEKREGVAAILRELELLP